MVQGVPMIDSIPAMKASCAARSPSAWCAAFAIEVCSNCASWSATVMPWPWIGLKRQIAVADGDQSPRHARKLFEMLPNAFDKTEVTNGLRRLHFGEGIVQRGHAEPAERVEELLPILDAGLGAAIADGHRPGLVFRRTRIEFNSLTGGSGSERTSFQSDAVCLGMPTDTVE